MQSASAKHFKVVSEEFEASMLGAPFEIKLLNSVTVICDDLGHVINYDIPDEKGLIAAIVVQRVLHRKKLSGAEVQFIRKSLGLRAKPIAKKIAVGREHFSRYENNVVPISAASEKLLRLFLCMVALKQIDYEADELLELMKSSMEVVFGEDVGIDTVQNEKIEFKFQRKIASYYNNENSGLPSQRVWRPI